MFTGIELRAYPGELALTRTFELKSSTYQYAFVTWGSSKGYPAMLFYDFENNKVYYSWSESGYSRGGVEEADEELRVDLDLRFNAVKFRLNGDVLEFWSRAQYVSSKSGATIIVF